MMNAKVPSLLNEVAKEFNKELKDSGVNEHALRSAYAQSNFENA